VRSDERDVRRAFEQRYYRRVIDAQFTDRKKGSARRSTTYQNVVGYGIGEKIANGAFTGDASLIVYVTEKVPDQRLNETRVPQRILGLPTDVVEVGEFRTLAGTSPCEVNSARRLPRPFPAGVSIGGGDNNAGTIGYRVKRENDSTQMILSNAHVLADLSNFNLRPPVFQPGANDGADPARDQIGVLRGVVALRFDGEPNNMDAAVAAIEPNICMPAICGIGKLNGAEDPIMSQPVIIFGKTSKGRRGFVRDLAADFTVAVGGRLARFTNQILIRRDPESPSPLAADGDSGAIVVKTGALACGLLFAGNDTGTMALANPIERVLGRFRVELV
jgi:hypothetical protein